jgi:hypothetical protein
VSSAAAFGLRPLVFTGSSAEISAAAPVACSKLALDVSATVFVAPLGFG